MFYDPLLMNPISSHLSGTQPVVTLNPIFPLLLLVETPPSLNTSDCVAKVVTEELKQYKEFSRLRTFFVYKEDYLNCL